MVSSIQKLAQQLVMMITLVGMFMITDSFLFFTSCIGLINESAITKHHLKENFVSNQHRS